MSGMSEETVSALITSLLPIMITVLFAWLSSRNDQSKRRQILDDAKQRIELISAYVSSQTLVIEDPAELGPIKRTAARELYDIKSFLEHKLQSMEKSSEKSESYFQRFFLLYPMRSGLASFLRALFFITLAVSVMWSIFLSSISFTPEEIQEFGWGLSIAMVLIFTVPVVVAALVLRWLAIKFDKPAVSLEPAEALP